MPGKANLDEQELIPTVHLWLDLFSLPSQPVALTSSRVLISIRENSRIAATMPSSANPPWYRDKHVWFRIVELVVILSATYIAWRSLERNTEGILASSSTQLFYADTQLEKEEYEGADKPVWTIYSRPDTDDPTAYCQQLLAAIAKHSKSIPAIPDADQLNKRSSS